MNLRSFAFGIVVYVLFCAPVFALETIRAQKGDAPEKEYVGRVLLEGPEGELLLQTRDGQLFQFAGKDILERKNDATPFVPYTPREMEPLLLREFGPDFSVLITDHYVLVYNTSKAYAQWCGALFDRLYGKFRVVWIGKKLQLHEPEFPLVAVVFANKKQFNAHGFKELEEGFSPAMSAYYHLLSNRIVLCDLTGRETNPRDATKNATLVQLRTILERPGSGYNISALVHEAAHQCCFNTGMFTRLTPVPLWLLEGIAMLHELPDIDNPRPNESGEPKKNRKRLDHFIQYMQKRPPDPVRSILLSDDPLRSTSTALDNYGLSWSLCYFLYKKKTASLVRYIEKMSSKEMWGDDSPELRLREFEAEFGELPKRFNRDFYRFMRTID